ncbi:MAG: DUF4169 family protein [Rhodosalinus sp.]
MAEQPINLKRHRKAKARIEAKRQADENAVTFGRSRAERARTRAEAERISRALDGLRHEE